jgi:hypothetical protein
VLFNVIRKFSSKDSAGATIATFSYDHEGKRNVRK